MELEIDKLNGELAFNEEKHIYWNTKHLDRKYTSVTTIISRYYPHFDDEFWSRYKALQKLVGEEVFDGPLKKSGKRGPASDMKKTLLDKKKFNYDFVYKNGIELNAFETEVLNIKASYKQAADDACVRGTEYHLAKENKWYESSKFKIGDLIPVDPSSEFVCEKHNFDLNRDKAILPEYLVYFTDKEGILHIAGQIDLLIKDGNDIYILDYKTNAKGMETKAYFDFKSKKTSRMYFPINNLDDHMLNHYTLQLSIYAWMLQRINPEFNIKLLRLLHIDGEGVETDYDVPYLKDDVERLLKHFKRTLKAEKMQEENRRLL